MASRSPEATRDGWGTDEESPAADHRDPAARPQTARERRLRARIAELEAELDRSEHRIQQVIDEYEALVEQRTGPDGPLARLEAWLRRL